MAGSINSPADLQGVATNLVCGFLGSGKTTFLLDQLRGNAADTVVLVNEFGELGLDGATIGNRSGVDVVEMSGGCICCSQKEGLVESILSIVSELSPKRLFLEPSGVAETSAMLDVLQDERLNGLIDLEAAITIVDASTFLEFSEPDAFGTFFRDQIANADMVVVNKIDLVDATDLDAVIQRAQTLSEGAVVVTAEHGRISETSSPNKRPRQIHRENTRLTFDRLNLPFAGKVDRSKLETFRSTLACGEYGRIVRAKGCLELEDEGWIEVQYSGKHFEERAGFPIDVPHLTVIGLDLVSDRLRADMGILPMAG